MNDQTDYEIPSAPESQALAQKSAFLVHESSRGEIVRKNVLRTTTLIGSHETCNLQLISSQVEPSHCVITLDGRGFRIWDLRSRIGTKVNGKKIRSTRLHHGDQVKIGSFTFQFTTTVKDESRQGFFIDDYRVLGILGTGGMGWLYAVEDPRTMQKFALKVLMRRANHPSVDQQELRTRFLLEAEAGAKGRLKHPNIINVLDHQHRSDVEYLLLELFVSMDLQELIQREGSLDPAFVCSIGLQTAKGLNHIHQAGSVHRDIKPSNLLIGPNGLVKICDFGLIFLGNDPIEAELASQMGKDCLGTADYIAPEQSFDSYQVDGRADIYGLGCALYLSLTGKLPFPAESNSKKIQSHRKVKPPSITALNPAVPQEIADIVHRCMEKDPQNRYQTGEKLAAALAPFARVQKIEFNFEDLIAKRTNQASYRLADPKKKHFLQRIPANVAASLAGITSEEHLGDEHTVINPARQSGIATHLPGDTSAAREAY
ncbi:MAG: protein kinase [Planctomycetaceae bacterium]|nr:protein kinase [Planctomycetaceae bacterium]